MVIKDENGKVIMLMNKSDILDYIFKKCGLEVGIEAKNIFKQADSSITQEECEGCIDLREKENHINTLENVLYDTQAELTKLKETYINYLKTKHYYAAAKALEEMEEN